MDPNSPPEGKWFCPTCEKKGPLGALIEGVDDLEPRAFQLPSELRDYFQGVSTQASGGYEESPVVPKRSRRARTTRTGHAEGGRDPYRMTDSKGKAIFCVRCRLAADGFRPMALCDYCPCYWHLDCLDPPLANPPFQRAGSDNPNHYWRCPNHIEHVIAEAKDREGKAYPRLRRPREPRFVDVDVLPDRGEMWRYTEKEMSGTVYRVADTGLILDFISSVKRKHAEDEADRAAASSAAQNTEDLGSVLPAERDAAMGLVSMASEPQPTESSYSGRMGQLVNQLVADAPEGVRNDMSEMELLQSLQGLVNQRIQALSSDSTSTN